MEKIDTASGIRSVFGFGLHARSQFHLKSQSDFSRFKQKNILMKYLWDTTKVLLLENSYSFSTKKMKEVRVNVVLSGVTCMGMTRVNTHNRTDKAGA